MEDKTVFIRTAKGRDAAVGILNTQLAPLLRVLLALIDGKSPLSTLGQKVAGQIPVDRLRAAIDILLTHEYIEIVRNTAREDKNLDFSFLNSAESSPEPTHEQIADALNTPLPGMRELKSAGCFVNKANLPTQRITPRSGDKYGVLIIGRDQSAVLLFARTLMLAGFNVRSAASRQEIMAELNKPPLPDAVLLNADLPGLNSLDVMALVRQHPQLAAVPIIVIASKLQEEEVAVALARGASAYMIKPCMPGALRATVHAVLGLAC
ncbi:MAG TPA: response regulator [Burkholderiales bacterium]|nr:response regulator [Burkholderiales bacterium]